MKKFKDRLVKVSLEEWEYFGKQSIDISGRIRKRGKQETDLGYWQRIGSYWDEIGGWTKDKDGTDTDWPWSSVFISYCIKLAGGEKEDFKFSIAHCHYIIAAIKKEIPWDYFDVKYMRPQVGDILCYHREQKGSIDYNSLKTTKLKYFRSHGDIITQVEKDRIYIIGGNVSNGVTKRALPLKNNIIDSNIKEWFCILRYQNMFL